MTVEDFVSSARTTVAHRLGMALFEEDLLKKPLDDFEQDELRKGDPVAYFTRLLEEDRFAVPTSNSDRVKEELADGVIGLARARHGVAQRWAQVKGAKTFSGLIETLASRDPSPSALLARLEQLVCDGHPAHPCAKTSLGLGDGYREVLPEQVENVLLRFVAIDPQLVQESGLGMLAALKSELPGLAGRIELELYYRGIANYAVIPVHPWQLDNIVLAEFDEEFSQGSMVLLDETAHAEPLMSVRTMRVSDCGQSAHVKLSLEAQLTGAVRGISAAALLGPELSKAIDTVMISDAGIIPRTRDDQPAFSTAKDLAGIRFNSSTGLRGRCLGAIVRRDPMLDANEDEIALPVAALMAKNPLTNNVILHDLLAELPSGADTVKQWFWDLAQVLVVPTLELAQRWGIALEPHPQNTVLILRNNLPSRVVVRDFGGARVLRDGRLATGLKTNWIAQHLEETPLMVDSLPRMVDKLSYPLLTNLMSELARLSGAEAEVWQAIAFAIAQAECRSQEKEVFQRVLNERLPRKRLLGMRLSNAVTEQEYVYVENPLSEYSENARSQLKAPLATVQWAEMVTRDRLCESAEMEGISGEELRLLETEVQNSFTNLAEARHIVDLRLDQHLSQYWSLIQHVPLGLVPAFADSLVVSGHNVHPLSKLRIGMDNGDSMNYAPEHFPVVRLRFLAVDSELLEHAEQGAFEILKQYYPDICSLAEDYVEKLGPDLEIILVHPWQFENIICHKFAKEIQDGRICIIPDLFFPARPTISIRTLVPHCPGMGGGRPMVKTAVDVVLTSTRRSISQHSALGTPAVAKVVSELIAEVGGESKRVRVVRELDGSTYRGESEDPAVTRALSFLIRESVSEVLEDGEVAIGGNALRGLTEKVDSPLIGLVQGDPFSWLRQYSSDLLGVTMPLMWKYGFALEAHLQNTMLRVKVKNGVPEYRGILLRDFSGLRIFAPRFEETGRKIPAQSGAVTITHDIEEFHHKGIYAVLFGNFEGLVSELSRIFEIPVAALWQVVMEELQNTVDAWVGCVPEADRSALFSSKIVQKAFVTMALGKTNGDCYVMVDNPLLVEAAQH